MTVPPVRNSGAKDAGEPARPSNETFSEKLILAVIDKLLLGLIAFVIGLWVQGQLSESEKVRNTILSVSKVNTELVSEQRKRLISNMARFSQQFHYFRGRIITGEEEKIALSELQQAEKEITNSLAQLNILEPELMKEPSGSLLTRIATVVEDLTVRQMPDEEIDQRISALYSEYRKILSAVRKVSVRAVEEDRMAVIDRHKEK